MQAEQKLNEILKLDFEKFFITKVEDLIRLMKLPVPPARVHNHSFIYLTQGEAVMSIGSDTYTIYQDECLFVPAGQVFSFNNVDENQGYICNFHNDFIIGKYANHELLNSFEFLNIWGNPVVKLGQQVSQYVHQLLQRIAIEYLANGLSNGDLLQAYFLAMLIEINSLYIPLSNSPQIQAVHLTNQFKALLFKNLKSKQLVSDYAALLHISPNHLNKTIKQITGKSPGKWIEEALVLEAKVLLHQTNFSIGEVAEEIGISEQSYFSRLFKKHTGHTPVAFRKMIEKS